MAPYSKRTEIAIPSRFYFRPERLLEASHRMPVDDRDFVPLLIYDHPFSLVTPTLKKVGEGAISLSLDRPFGFMTRSAENTILESQKTDGIILTSDPNDQEKWRATLTTPEALTPTDFYLFPGGIIVYVAYFEAGQMRPPEG